VIACNTISATCLPELQKISSVPVIGVIKPTVNEIINNLHAKTIGIIGTRATVNSNSYEKEIKKLNDKTLVFSQACPLLVPLAEEGFIDHLSTKIIVQEYLQIFKNKKIDTLVLGCTHYPILRNTIKEVMGKNIKIIDPAKSVAKDLINILTINNLLGNTKKPAQYFFFTDITSQTQKTVNVFFDNNFSGKLEKITI
jgi:glutamate racemase